MSTVYEWAVFLGTLAGAAIVITVGFTLTALVVEHREVEKGTRQDYIALGGCITTIIVAGLILSTL